MNRRTMLGSISGLFCSVPLLLNANEKQITYVHPETPEEKMRIITKMMDAHKRNILVYDAQADAGFSKRLVSLLKVITRRNSMNDPCYTSLFRERLEKVYYPHNNKPLLPNEIFNVKLIPTNLNLTLLYKEIAGYLPHSKENCAVAVSNMGNAILGAF